MTRRRPTSTSGGLRSGHGRGRPVCEATAMAASASAARRRDRASSDSAIESSTTIDHHQNKIMGPCGNRHVPLHQHRTRYVKERDRVKWPDVAAKAKTLDQPRDEYRLIPIISEMPVICPMETAISRTPAPNNMASTESMPRGAATSSV